MIAFSPHEVKAATDTVASEIGRGSTFKVLIPAVREAELHTLASSQSRQEAQQTVLAV